MGTGNKNWVNGRLGRSRELLQERKQKLTIDIILTKQDLHVLIINFCLTLND